MKIGEVKLNFSSEVGHMEITCKNCGELERINCSNRNIDSYGVTFWKKFDYILKETPCKKCGCNHYCVNVNIGMDIGK